MEATLLTVGLACVVAAIVGGGLKAFNIELPGVASLGRQVLLGGFGLLLTVLGLFGIPSRENGPPDDTRDGTTNCASAIEFGDEVECRIASQGAEQTHEFEGREGDRVAVRVIKAVNITPETEVRRPDGTLECGPGWSGIDRCTLDTTGTHGVVVRDGYRSKTGSYVLRLDQLPAGTSVGTEAGRCVSAIHYGQEVACPIARPADEQTHEFRGKEGDRIVVRVVRAVNISPETEVRRPDGTLECGPGWSGIDRCTLDTTGTHSLVVRDGYKSKTGSYVLRLEGT